MRYILLILVLEFMLVQYKLNNPLAARIAASRPYLAKHYAQGVLERVAKHRGLLDTRKDVSGYASVPNCDLIGDVIVVSLEDPRYESWSPPARLLIADCSADADRPRHLAEGLALETDYATAISRHFAWDGTKGEGKTLAVILGYER